ncbi:PadR family transcriptional regulator [Dactylosporangium sp. NPDC051541]|uniref:PadR family transcriptional regulator n=1 Tax=Dactylosporangium sp. NPDC051541 TaxID=3363977 RepID=UPI0037A1090D
MTIAYALLGLLEGTSRHGYDLKQSYDRRFGGAKPVRFGQVYRTLAQLERAGRVTVLGVEAGGGPDRRRYAITPEGVTELGDWLAAPEDPQPQLQTVLFTKVALALMSGRPAGQYLDTQRARHLGAMQELTAARRAAPDAQAAMLIDYQLFHIEADLRWLDHAERGLDALAEEVCDDPGPARA